MQFLTNLKFFVFISFCDVPVQYQLGLQDAATHDMNSIQDFYDILMFCIIAIGSFVFYLLFYIIFNFRHSVHQKSEQFAHSNELEIVWTIIPTVILFCLAIPSFKLLYQIEHFKKESIIIKVVGHQWYWSYEVAGPINDTLGIIPFGFNSYMLKGQRLVIEDFEMFPRLLQTDAPLVLPIKTPIKLLVTATDVIHSWAVPSFGVKIDATPGRINQVILTIERTGNFYGQCSEICGVNHGFMPIHVFAVTLEQYITGLLFFAKKELFFSNNAFRSVFFNTFVDTNVAYAQISTDEAPKKLACTLLKNSTIEAASIVSEYMNSTLSVETPNDVVVFTEEKKVCWWRAYVPHITMLLPIIIRLIIPLIDISFFMTDTPKTSSSQADLDQFHIQFQKLLFSNTQGRGRYRCDSDTEINLPDDI